MIRQPVADADQIWTGSKKQRAALYARFGGRCGYCGQVMDRMQADHIQPVIRITTDPWGKPLPPAECRMIKPERNTVANMMPACAPCNLHKGGYGLEEWRALLARAGEVLSRDKSIFRAALRFGVVSLSADPIIFYFERHQSND